MTFLLLWHRSMQTIEAARVLEITLEKLASFTPNRDAHTSSRVLQTRSWRASEKSPRHFRTCVRLVIVDG